MNEEEIRRKYQREDENDLRGTNVKAMDRFIEMLYLHEKSEDSRIRDIVKSFEHIDKLAPNFQVFQGNGCFFMHNFKAYQIAEDTDMLSAVHEFGHAILSIMNDTVVPENYGDVIKRAKEHAISDERRKDFVKYIQYLSGKTEQKDDRTEAEKGPLSDIISSIFQFQALRVGSFDNICVLPSSHNRSYYYDEEKGVPNVKNIFDEDFANYYSLKVNNANKEIETIRFLFGDEFAQALDEQLEKVKDKSLTLRDDKHEEVAQDPIEQIKNVVVFTRQGELENISKEEKNKQKSEGERNE